MDAAQTGVAIAVYNRQRYVHFDLTWLKKFAPCALARCVKYPAKSSSDTALMRVERVEIAIVSDKKIAEVHEQFMRIAGATDVITFDHGEIVISADTAKQNAERFSQSLEHELALYIIHGLLHLNGHDDRRPASAATMRRLQERILKECLKELG